MLKFYEIIGTAVFSFEGIGMVVPIGKILPHIFFFDAYTSFVYS